MEIWEQDLRNEELFYQAVDVFIEMQIQGRLNPSIDGEILIDDLFSGVSMWENMDDKTHQEVGKLIAHYCPEFAALCRELICIVFDRSDTNGNGIYRRVRYRK